MEFIPAPISPTTVGSWVPSLDLPSDPGPNSLEGFRYSLPENPALIVSKAPSNSQNPSSMPNIRSSNALVLPELLDDDELLDEQ